MKKNNRLFERIADLDNLRLASWKAAKGKRCARAVLAYQQNLEANLLRLREQILNGQIEVGNYRYFKIYEPKERQICASAFPEQVLHHGVMNVCHHIFERAQIFDSYASRKGKGTIAAIGRAQRFTHKYGWFLKLDVRKFFESIHHDVVKGQLGRLFKEKACWSCFSKLLTAMKQAPTEVCPSAT